MDYSVSDFNFSLPADRIAQEPCLPRDQARLLVLDRKTGERQHRSFRDILDYLDPGDVLVVNNTRVVPVLLAGKKATGGKVECLILHYPEETAIGTHMSPCLLTSRGKIRPGDRLEFGQGVEAEVLAPAPNGTACLRFFFEGPFEGVLKEERPGAPSSLYREAGARCPAGSQRPTKLSNGLCRHSRSGGCAHSRPSFYPGIIG